MKTSLVLLLVLPIVAFAAVLPRHYTEFDVVPTHEPTHEPQDETLLEKIRDMIKDSIGKVEHDLKNEASKLEDAVHKVEEQVFGGTIHDVLEKIKEEIKEKVDEVKKQLDQLKGQAKEKYEEVKQKVQDTIKQLKDKLTEKLVEAYIEFDKLEQQIGEKIAQLEEEAKQKYGEIIQSVKEAIEKVRKELHEKLQKGKELLTAAEEQLKQKVTQAEEEFKKVVEQVKEKFPEATEKLKEAVTKAEEELKQKVAQAQEEYKKIKEQVKEEIHKIEEQIKHVIGKRDITDIWNKIKEKLTQIKAKIEETATKIQQELTEEFNKAKQQFDKLKEEAKKEVEEVKKLIHDIIGQVQEQLKQKLEQLKQEYNKLHDEAQQKLDQLEQELKKAYGEIKGQLEEAMKNIKKIVEDKITEAKQQLQQAEQKLKERLDKAKQDFEKAVQEAKEKYGPELEKLKEEVTKAEEELKKELAQAQQEFNKVKEEIKQEIAKLIDDIKHIIDGDQAKFLNLAMFSADPEVNMHPAEIIAYWGYPAETHHVTTEDGYVLTLFRIPHGRNVDNASVPEHRPVVFLQHGLDGSAADFVANLPNQAAAYVLADAGYDVWMGNFRGNKYSRDHASMTTTNHTFWEFSWTEMADQDLPAMIDYALKTSKAQDLYYVGFSIGTTTAFAKLSEDATFAKKIKKFYALGPMASTSHVKGPLRWMAPFTGAFEYIFNLVGMDEFQPNQWLMDMAAKYFCNNVVTKLVCSNALFLIGGPNSNQLNTTRLPVYLSHSPSGTSTRTIIHIGQMIHAGKLRAFDFGNKEKNQERYHQDTPKEYDLTKIETPVSIFAGGHDWLAAPEDVQELMPKLKNVNLYTLLPDFNHFDFIWGLRAAPQVYWPIRNDIRADFKATNH